MRRTIYFLYPLVRVNYLALTYNKLAAFSDVLAKNNNDRLVEEEITLICNKYESSGSMTAEQKSFAIRYLEKELLDS